MQIAASAANKTLALETTFGRTPRRAKALATFLAHGVSLEAIGLLIMSVYTEIIQDLRSDVLRPSFPKSLSGIQRKRLRDLLDSR